MYLLQTGFLGKEMTLTKGYAKVQTLMFPMIKALSWNIRSVNTQCTFERLKTIKAQYNLSFICLQEPFVRSDQIMTYMRQLGMEGCHSNSNHKIWTFWSNDFEVKVQDNSQQQVTFQVCHKDTNVMYYLTNVYAKCRKTLRKELWTELVTISNRLNGPWAVVGDLNVIFDSMVKKGG